MDKYISPILSIIIPVYNVEEYIETCISSIVTQIEDTMAVEILLIDDGSTDNSGNLCDDIRRKHPGKIIVIHKENGGLSDARNVGLTSAKGMYVSFLDSDDYYAPNAIAQFFNAVSQNADILAGALYIFRDGTNNLVPHEYFHKDISRNIFTMEDALDVILTRCPTYGWYAWKYFIKRELLIKKNLIFKKGILFEDIEWTPRIFCAAESVAFLPEPFYCYRTHRKGSIMNKSNPKKYMDALCTLEQHLIWIKRIDVEESIKNKLLENWSGVYTNILYGQFDIKDYDVRKRIESLQFMIPYIIREKEIHVKDKYNKGGYKAVYAFYRRKHLIDTVKNIVRIFIGKWR